MYVSCWIGKIRWRSVHFKVSRAVENPSCTRTNGFTFSNESKNTITFICFMRLVRSWEEPGAAPPMKMSDIFILIGVSILVGGLFIHGLSSSKPVPDDAEPFANGASLQAG